MSRSAKAPKRASASSVRNLNYATSPLLASKTPPWRSRFVVALVGPVFRRADRPRGVHPDHRHRLLPAARREALCPCAGRAGQSRPHRSTAHGQVLATSVPVPSIWAIPKDFDADVQQRKALARLLGMKPAELEQRLEGSRNFAWLSRQVDEALWSQVKAWALKGVHQLREYRRNYPEGESAAHIVGFTNIEEKGQEGIELAFQQQLQGRDGSRSVVRDRLGRVVEDIGEQVDPVNGHDIQLSIDSKVQFFAYQRVRDAVAEHGARAGSVVVLDVRTGEVLALANYPSFDPGNRSNLSGAQLRNRALTDTFEPGSTMKPFVIALALESGRVTPATMIQTAPGSISITGSTIKDAHPHGLLSVAAGDPEVEQRRHRQAGDADAPARDVGAVRATRHRPEAADRLSRRGHRAAAAVQELAADRAGDDELRLRPVGVAVPAGPRLQRAGARRRTAADLDACARSSPRPACACCRRRPPSQCARCCRWPPGRAAPRRRRRRWAIRWAARPAPRTSRRGAPTPPTSTAPGSSAWRRSHDPRIVVAVMVDEPSKGVYYGGEVAAPVFSQVVQQTLRLMGVPPDLDVAPQIITDSAAAAVRESF